MIRKNISFTQQKLLKLSNSNSLIAFVLQPLNQDVKIDEKASENYKGCCLPPFDFNFSLSGILLWR
jgi:hypothetical protein